MAVVYKEAIIRRVAKDTRLSQWIVSDVLNGAMKEITASLNRGDTVQVTNFGTLYSRVRTDGKARDFKTGRRVDVAARTVAAFRVGTLLKKAVGRTPIGVKGRPKLRKFLSRLSK
jgi:DNA-binding protein HU-beta